MHESLNKADKIFKIYLVEFYFLNSFVKFKIGDMFKLLSCRHYNLVLKIM